MLFHMKKKYLLSGLILALILSGCALNLPQDLIHTISPSAAGGTPGASQAGVATDTPAPTATPLPSVRLDSGELALWNGDYDTALSEYKTALEGSQDKNEKAAALLGYAHAQIGLRDLPGALTTLRTLVDGYPQAPNRADAVLLLGRTYDELNRPQDAADAYASYLQLEPGVIDTYVQEWRGDALVAVGNYTDAIVAYQAAYKASHLGSGLDLEIKSGQAYAALGEYATAIEKYNAVYVGTKDDYQRAEADLLTGQAYLALGNTAAAYERFQDAVNNFPRAYDSYSALVALVDAGQTVDDLNRGLVDYYAGQYGVALEAFNRYLAANPEANDTVYYYKALTQTALGNYQDAIQEWNNIILKFPDGNYWDDAWEEKAYTQWAYLDQYTEAAATLTEFVNRFPGADSSPGFLYDAGRILERANQLEAAATTWERMVTEYPANEQTQQAVIMAGVLRFRMGNPAAAQATFQRAVLLATTPVDKARANFWVGKAQQAQNNTADALKSFQTAAAADPGEYYSERARDILLNREPFAAPTTIDLATDPVNERAAAEAWMRTTFPIPEGTDLSGLGELANDPRVIRGKKLWSLGFLDEGRLELEDVRNEYAKDPVNTYRLMNLFVDIGLYRSAIFASRQVLDLAGLTDFTSLNAPVYFNHIRFGTYYKDIVLPVAEKEGLDPLFIFALMRQESLFEGFVHSSAGARGLMQIIPDTAVNIVQDMNYPQNYDPEDLYRPVVSIRLGVHYLAQQRSYFDGNIYAALAAYNAGPGNASTWQGLAGNDIDLYLESIRYQETRDYVTQIAEFYSIYRQFYNRSAN